MWFIVLVILVAILVLGIVYEMSVKAFYWVLLSILILGLIFITNGTIILFAACLGCACFSLILTIKFWRMTNDIRDLKRYFMEKED